MIKKILITLGGLFIFVSSLYSQEITPEYKHQIQVGYGYNMFNRVYTGLFTDEVQIKLSNDHVFLRSIRNEKETVISSFNFYYHVRIKERGSLGISFITDFYKRTYETPYKEKLYSVKDMAQSYTFMPNLYYYYLNDKTVRLYFGVELGVMYFRRRVKEINYQYDSNTTSKFLPVFNITPIGMRLKYRFSPYIQVNIGSRGWIEGGLSYQFGQK